MRILLLFILLASAACRRDSISPPSTAGQKTHRARSAEETLKSTRLFSFGGVGIAGTTADGELAVREILARGDALSKFRRVVEEGTMAGKLYALCGVRRLAPKEFEAAALPVERANRKVTTAFGCMVGETEAAGIIREIRAGSYQSFLEK